MEEEIKEVIEQAKYKLRYATTIKEIQAILKHSVGILMNEEYGNRAQEIFSCATECMKLKEI